MKMLNFITKSRQWNRQLSERAEKFYLTALPILAAIIIIAWGVDLRYNFSYPHFLESNNVASYYYSKSEILYETGSFSRIDERDRSGTQYQENAPPGLAFFTVGIFKINKIFSPNLNFIDFARYFPIIVYVLWSLSGLAVIYDLTGKKTLTVFFLFLLAVIPSSIELTRLGNYFEEVLGVWLLFLAIWSLTKIEKSWYWTAISGLLLTALALTWQQFPVFYVIAAAILALELIIKRKNFKKFSIRLLTVLTIPLILGEVIALALGIAYSPVYMLKELWVSIGVQRDPTLAWVMRRSDWRNFSINDFIKSFGYLGAGLAILGFLEFLKNFIKERTARVFLAFSPLAIILPLFFLKERFLALGIILFFCVFGARFLFSPSRLNIKGVLVILSRAKNLLFRPFLKDEDPSLTLRMTIIIRFALLFALTTAILTITVFFYINPFKNNPPPEPRLTLSGIPEKWEIGKTYKITARLENIGGDSLKEKGAFGGLHIETTNAIVGYINASSPLTKSTEAFKDYAQWGNAYFFETKYDRLKKGEYGEATFNVTPTWLPVEIYYRGWLPGHCSRIDRKAVLKELFPEWQKSSSGWRSENCIIRAPANNDLKEELCKVPVMAAHKEPIPYRCFVK